jgi:alcohol dehydrogenase (cytochrome c)
VDPTTGDIKASIRLDYANYAGALATAGNLVFLGHVDGTFSAYDARTLTELWSFNAGTGINAPPISYAVNGKQYVAVLVGSRQPGNILAESPELKNTSTASMLFVFSL